MKFIIKCFLPVCLLIFLTGCDDQNFLHEKYLEQGETVYPGMPTALIDSASIEKVKFSWTLNADPRIVKSVIYWNDGEKDDSLVVPRTSTNVQEAVVNIKEGTYEFKIMTVDSENHKSLPVTKTVQVYGPKYISTVYPRDIDRSEMQTGGDLKITWAGAPENLLYTFVTYLDHSGNLNGNGVSTKTDTIYAETAETTLTGFRRVKPFTIRSVYRIGIDTVSVSDAYLHRVSIPENVLAANGITEATDEVLLGRTVIANPLNLEDWTLGYLAYFPNLQELDLTAGTETLPEYTYTGNNVSSTVGGGPWLDFASGYMSDNDRATIRNLLSSGQLTKVKYRRSSYPRLDADLEPYSDRVEWIPAEPLPDALMIPPNLLLDYRVAESDKGATVEHSEDGSNVPAEIAEKFDGDLKNVYRVTVTAQNSTVAFSMPKGTQFGFVPHGNLKFDAYIETTDPEYGWMKAGISQAAAWNVIRRWRETRLSQFPESSKYTNGSTGPENGLSWDVDTELGTWKQHEWALVTVPQEHRTVIRLQFGNDGLWPLPSGQTLTYYIANLRWVK